MRMAGLSMFSAQLVCLCDRNQHAKFGSLARFTVYFDLAPMGFDDEFGVEEPDAEALLLCGLERTEQRFLDKFFRHPTTVVPNCEADRLAFMNHRYLNDASAVNRFVR